MLQPKHRIFFGPDDHGRQLTTSAAYRARNPEGRNQSFSLMTFVRPYTEAGPNYCVVVHDAVSGIARVDRYRTLGRDSESLHHTRPRQVCGTLRVPSTLTLRAVGKSRSVTPPSARLLSAYADVLTINRARQQLGVGDRASNGHELRTRRRLGVLAGRVRGKYASKRMISSIGRSWTLRLVSSPFFASSRASKVPSRLPGRTS